MENTTQFRYEVRIIQDAEMTTLCDETLYCGSDLAHAKECAAEANYIHGAAVVDTVEGTVDWGHAVTKLGEPAPGLNAAEI